VEQIRSLKPTSALPSQQASLQRTRIWVQVGSVNEAIAVAKGLSPDVLVLQGSDAGGHGLTHSGSIMALIPETYDALSQLPGARDIALMAAGGIMDGRGLAAARMLGAHGVVMGTRFLASMESTIAKGYQKEILQASDGGLSTVRSTVYDHARGIHGWPERYNGRG
jgi:nitronate monooxygenase